MSGRSVKLPEMISGARGIRMGGVALSDVVNSLDP